MPRQKKVKIQSLTNIKSKLCTDPVIADNFINDVLRVTGLEYDSEGYIVDAEENPIEPDYIMIKGKVLRHTNMGIVHNNDLVFDPYNNPIIMEELFKKYVEDVHPEIVSTQIFAASTTEIPRTDTYGYIAILYGNGARIVTNNHYKDATKYLEAFMRLESMTDTMINDVIQQYDIFEQKWFEENK
jgi:hypothetical protein